MLSITFLVLPVGFIPRGVVKEASESVMFQFPQFQTNCWVIIRVKYLQAVVQMELFDYGPLIVVESAAKMI